MATRGQQRRWLMFSARNWFDVAVTTTGRDSRIAEKESWHDLLQWAAL